jgi:hypothetical protein
LSEARFEEGALADRPASTDRTLPSDVSSNGIRFAFDSARFAPMRDSTDLLADPQALRERFHLDGYLCVRGVLDADRVRAARADYFARFDSGLFAPGTSPADGVFSGQTPAGLPEYGTEGHPAHAMVREAGFDRFTRDPALAAVASDVLAGPVEMLPRRILRHFHRGLARASRAHVDYDYMDHGSDRTVTTWIPLGDCPIECGGLIYLEDSHRLPREQLDRLRGDLDDPRPISADLARTADVLDRRWLWADLRAGDVLLHSPHIVHASLDNASDVMRLSADLRFARRDAGHDERWNGDWSADDGF